MGYAGRANERTITFCLLLMWALIAGGCAMPQHAERYVYERDGKVVAEAWRYAGNPDHPVHQLWIDLGASPVFEVRLPDGLWINAREVTSAGLAQHGLSVSKIGEVEHAIWHPAFTPGALVGRHSFMDFHHDATKLELGACGWSFRELVRTPDGKCSFGFPATPTDLACLLGSPSRVERIAMVTGLGCF